MTRQRSNTDFEGGVRGPGWATSAFYGMKGDNAFNNKTAFQAAMEDVADMNGGNGGTLYLGPGIFRVGVGLLDYQRGCNIVGSSYGTYLINDHASNDFFNFTITGQSKFPGVSNYIKNVNFGALQTCSGTLFDDSTGSPFNMRLINCTVNDPYLDFPLIGNLQGRIVHCTTNSSWGIRNCRIWQKATAASREVFNFTSGGNLRVRDSYIKVPDTSSSQVLAHSGSGKAWIMGNEFDLVDSSDTPRVLGVYGSGQYFVIGNSFKGNINNARAVMWNSGVRLIERGNIFENITAYDSSSAPLAGGSELTLGRPLEISSSGNSFVAGQYTGYRAVSIKTTSTSSPTIAMPPCFYPGQEFTVTLWNDSGGLWSGIAFTGDTIGGNVTTGTATGTMRTFHFKALAYRTNGTLFWVCIGDMSAPITVP